MLIPDLHFALTGFCLNGAWKLPADSTQYGCEYYIIVLETNVAGYIASDIENDIFHKASLILFCVDRLR